MDVTVVENSDNTVHITLPMAPDGHEEMSMDELSQAWQEGTIPGFFYDDGRHREYDLQDIIKPPLGGRSIFPLPFRIVRLRCMKHLILGERP